MYVFPVVDGTPLPADWARFARPARRTRTPSDPADIAAHRDDWLQQWSDVTSAGDEPRARSTPRRPGRLGAGPPGRAGGLLRAARSPGCSAAASWSDGTFDPARGARGAGRPRDPPGRLVHALVVGGRARRSRCSSACPPRTCCTASTSRAGRLLRALLAGAVRAADRRGRRRLPAAARRGRAARVPRPRRHPGRDRRRAGVLQRRRRDPRRRRRLGVPRPAPGRGRRRARRHARGRCSVDVTLPALRPAIVSAASVVFLFCATAFGVVLTLGGLRYSTRRDRDLPAHHQPARPAGRGRPVDPPAGRRSPAAAGRAPPGAAPYAGRRRWPAVVARPRRPGARRPAGPCRRPALLLVLVAAPLGDPGRRLAAASTARLEPGQLPRPDRPPAPTRRCWSRSPTALVNSLRIAVDATWMSLSARRCSVALDRDPALAVPRRAAACAACSTGSSCCRSGSPR